MSQRLYWISEAPGRLATMPRPRAGDWLADEMAALQSLGVDTVVSLLTDDENAELDLQHEPAICDAQGLAFLAFPIPDRQVPLSVEDFVTFVNHLYSTLSKGQAVAVHCRMGIGRASLVAACLLVKSGLGVLDAFKSISRDRGIDVPDTEAQIDWVASIASRLADGHSAT